MRGYLLILLFIFSTPSFALETDQFTLPPSKLEDFGPVLESWFRGDLNAAVNALPPSATEDQVRAYFFNHISRCEVGARRLPLSFMGGFCFVFFLENYLKQLNVSSAPLVWSFFPKNSIYEAGASPGSMARIYENGSRFQALSSTINLFGFYIGTDKPSHFIKLGRDYYNYFNKLRLQGVYEKTAVTLTIERMGVDSEAGFLGFDVSGNYANADLAANFAGFWFYRNLFEEIQWNGKLKKPIIARNKITKLWEIQTSEILKPFFSLHMSEAFNPGTFVKGPITDKLFKTVLARCTQWNARFPQPGFWRAFGEKAQTLKTLNGWDYGWRRASGNTPELDKLCSSSQLSKKP